MTFELGDGRRLGYAERGAAKGHAVVLLRGICGPGAELDGDDYRAAFAASGCRVIAVDLPGSGLSDPATVPGDWQLALDVDELLDSLDIEWAVVIGSGAGAIAALAVAVGLPDRIVAAGLDEAEGLHELNVSELAVPVVVAGNGRGHTPASLTDLMVTTLEASGYIFRAASDGA